MDLIEYITVIVIFGHGRDLSGIIMGCALVVNLLCDDILAILEEEAWPAII